MLNFKKDITALYLENKYKSRAVAEIYNRK